MEELSKEGMDPRGAQNTLALTNLTTRATLTRLAAI